MGNYSKPIKAIVADTNFYHNRGFYDLVRRNGCIKPIVVVKSETELINSISQEYFDIGIFNWDFPSTPYLKFKENVAKFQPKIKLVAFNNGLTLKAFSYLETKELNGFFVSTATPPQIENVIMQVMNESFNLQMKMNGTMPDYLIPFSKFKEKKLKIFCLMLEAISKQEICATINIEMKLLNEYIEKILIKLDTTYERFILNGLSHHWMTEAEWKRREKLHDDFFSRIACEIEI